MAYHRDKNYTREACEARTEAISEHRFMTAIRAASDKELADIKANLEELLSKTPARHVWVADRRKGKLGQVNYEISKRLA